MSSSCPRLQRAFCAWLILIATICTWRDASAWGNFESHPRTLRAQAAFRAEIDRLPAAAKIEIDAAALSALSAAPPANVSR